jgi:hypothetical protein
LITRYRHGVLVGLSDTTTHGTRPGERKARLLLQVLHDRQADVLRFAHDLKVPPTSNQAERDLRHSKVQQNISGRLTSENRNRDRYKICGYASTAAKHGLNMLTALPRRTARPAMDARTTRAHLTLRTHPNMTGDHKPPVITQRHHTEHSHTPAECLHWSGISTASSGRASGVASSPSSAGHRRPRTLRSTEGRIGLHVWTY